MESQNTSSQDWLEDVCGGPLPLFFPDPEDDPPLRDDRASSDSDKENEPPSLEVPPLPWAQRSQVAGILTRIAFGHETMASNILELRDLVLGIQPNRQGDAEVQVGLGEEPGPEEHPVQVVPSETRDLEARDSGSETEEEPEIPAPVAREVTAPEPDLATSLTYRLKPGFRAKTPTSASNLRASQSFGLESGFSMKTRMSAPLFNSSATPPSGELVAAVIVEALNTNSKCKIEVITLDSDSDASPANGGKDRKSTRLNSSHSGESRMPSSA